jgi:aspartate kinase
MALLVHKYGGTSVGTTERIKTVARRLSDLRRQGHDIVVVVSAMGDTTDDLLALAAEITENPHRREMDMLLTAGERISMALLSMALNALDTPAISFTGSQSGIITDSGHGHARIQAVRPIRIREELDRGRIVIVAGFQGVSPEKEVTTLGRGGSDTSAVALAVAFGAAECVIYTDVDGVMTADPRVVPGARLLDHLDFDAMLEFSSRGAGVIYSRAVELARNHKMPLQILNSLREARGTRIDGEVSMERKGIAGVTANERIVGVHLSHLSLNAAEIGGFVESLSGLGFDITGLHEFDDGPGTVGLTFIVPDLPENGPLFKGLEDLVRSRDGIISLDVSAGAVSVVGGGVINSAEVAARSLRSLTAAGIAPHSFLSGTLSMTFLVPRGQVAEAVRALHKDLVE